MSLLRRRALALAIFAVAVILAALSGHVLHLPFSHIDGTPIIVLALALVAWIGFGMHARNVALAALERDAAKLHDAAHDFGVRAEAWLVSSATVDELEAEALRRVVVDRHTALVAAVRAHLNGLDPHDDSVVQAMTRAAERKGRHGQALLLHLAALQREALAESQRRGFLGEARLLSLDDQLFTLSTVRPLAAPRPSLEAKLLALLVPALAIVMVLGHAQRLTTTLAATLAGFALIAFEAYATTPVDQTQDPRIAALASW